MVKMPHWPKILGYKPIDLRVDRMHMVLNRLGNPHKSLAPVIHVAGTNGKGSTIAFMRSILETAGYRVHSYTSPHLVEFNERIVVAGEKISDEFLYEVLEEARKAFEGIEVTFFEGTTIAAFLAFARVKADIVLLETGMGGRLDATNVIENPILTIITSISIDHAEYLGDTIQKIAAEKAAIIKRNVPCVSVKQIRDVAKIIEQEAASQSAELLIAGDYPNYKSQMCGDFQRENIALAVTAIKKLKKYHITEDHIIEGIKNAEWPARLQKINTGKLTRNLSGKSELWLDGGHNKDAAKEINKSIKKWPAKNTYMVMASMNNRDCKGFIKKICHGVDIKRLYGVCVPGADNFYKEDEIAQLANECGIESAVAKNVQQAIEEITENDNDPVRILICGSLYLAGSVLAENSQRD